MEEDGGGMRLASLFDGSGGFPLGGMFAGIEPVWASEVEPFPIRVTTKRMPKMKHYGDVSKIDGAKVEPVDIITFGSPCQDMSVAGKRAGLDGNRSGLFYQAIRIIKEMRGATNGLYPRYAVWENVPGAFTSNAGQDFRAVLEEVCKVRDPNASIPKPEKWLRAGLILGDGYSVAWRQLDAQYWGVPQRRKRIYLVADFSGESAGKILFESESVSGYSSPSRSPWKRVARNTTQSVGETVVLNDQGGETNVIPAVLAIENHPTDSRVRISDDGNVETLTSRMGTGGGNVPLLLKIRQGQTKGGMCVVGNYSVRRLTPMECARLQGFPDTWCDDLETPNPTKEDLNFWRGVFKTYTDMTGTKMKTDAQIIKWLQAPHSDSAEYKMWGNGVALPCVVFVMSGIAWANKEEDTDED